VRDAANVVACSDHAILTSKGWGTAQTFRCVLRGELGHLFFYWNIKNDK
jgi:hypothetical protein